MEKWDLKRNLEKTDYIQKLLNNEFSNITYKNKDNNNIEELIIEQEQQKTAENLPFRAGEWQAE